MVAAFQFGGIPAQLLFGHFQVGNIVYNARIHFAVVKFYLADTQMKREGRAIFSFASHFPANANDFGDTRSVIVVHIPIVLASVGFRHQDVYFLSQQFAWFVAKYPGRRRVNHFHHAVAVNGNDAIYHAGQNGIDFILTHLQSLQVSFLFGNILDKNGTQGMLVGPH